MKKHHHKFTTFLLLSGLFAFYSSPAFAQSVLFDFDNAPLHSPLPIDLTAGGINAHFSANPTYYNYSIQRADALGFTPVGFAGYCIYPNTINLCDLLISFDHALADISIMYAPEEYATDSSCTMRITAYLGATVVGTNTYSIPEPGTWPTGTLSFSSTQPFDNVVIHYDAPPVTGGDYGPIFMADNLTVTVAATPAPTATPTPTPPPPVCTLGEGFDLITTLVPGGWVMQNNSQPGPGATGWFQGDSSGFPSQSGPPNSYIAANSANGTGISTLSNWLLTPPVTLQNGAQSSFWTRTIPIGSIPPHNRPNRLQVRMSTNGASQDVGTQATDVGDFITLLLDINPTYAQFGYPNVWTQFTVTVSGVASPTTGRLAFRYFVENGGPSGANSDYIAIDTVQYNCNGPIPTPTPTATPTPTPTPALVSISGTVVYCSNPSLNPVPGVMLTLTGSASGSTLSDGSGNYTFTSLASGGNYTVTPAMADLTPASAGINTVDVIATQMHFLQIALLSGCQLTAANVNGDTVVSTVDVVAIQRFFIGRTFGLANVGKYQFTPASRTYTGIVSDQTAQNYDTLVFGDVAPGFIHRPEAPSQDALGDDLSAAKVPATVASVALPEVAVAQSRNNFIAAVRTSAIDAKNKLVGFQGDFTFDERVVTFQSEPVQKAGITGGNWNVSGNVLPGAGPIRTLRISAYSNDLMPLSGSGTLFELRMTRVSQGAKGTQLLWAAPPDQFIFIDADLKTQKPGYVASGGVTLRPSGR